MALWLLLTVPEVAGESGAALARRHGDTGRYRKQSVVAASETVAALVVALFKVTVQVLDALLPMVEGAHATDVSCAGALAREREGLRNAVQGGGEQTPL